MRKLTPIVAALVLALGATAIADDDPKVGVSYPARTREINKRIAMVDVYLVQALTNAKALSNLADTESGQLDNQLVQEARRNLDAAIDRGLAHLKGVREYKSDLAMAAQGQDSAAATGSAQTGMAQKSSERSRISKLDELEKQLKEAKAAARQLTSAKQEQLANAVDGVATHLVAAHISFKDIAKWTSYTLLEDTNLATVPVSGSGDNAAPTQDRMGTERTQPPAVNPNSTPTTPTAPPNEYQEGKGTGQNPNLKPEPVQPAPGGGKR